MWNKKWTDSSLFCHLNGTFKRGDEERFDKEQIRVKEPFPVTNLTVYFIKKGTLGIKQQV